MRILFAVLIANHSAAIHINVGGVAPAQAAIITDGDTETSQAHRYPGLQKA
jgi:hypothetical protein